MNFWVKIRKLYLLSFSWHIIVEGLVSGHLNQIPGSFLALLISICILLFFFQFYIFSSFDILSTGAKFLSQNKEEAKQPKSCCTGNLKLIFLKTIPLI